MNLEEVLPRLAAGADDGEGAWADVVQRAARISRRRRNRRAAVMVVVVVVAAILATPAIGIGSRLLDLFSQPRHETVTATVSLTPTRRSVSVSHSFDHNTGFARVRLVVPSGVGAELLIKTPVEVATGQRADVSLCTPQSHCTSLWRRTRGSRAWFTCQSTAVETICEERVPSSEQDAIFPPGSYVFTVREFAPKTARISIAVTFLRGS